MQAYRNSSLVVILATALVGSLLVVTSNAQDKPTTQASGGVSGTWTWEQQGPNGARPITLKLKQDGDKVTGTITGFQGQDNEIRDGMVKDGEVTFKVVREFGGRQNVTTYTGKVDGNSFKGKSETVTKADFDAKRGE